MGSERPLMGSERTLMGSERPMMGYEKPLMGSERPLMRCESPLTGSERPLIRYEAIGGSGWGDVGCTYGHMDVRREYLPHCVVQDCTSSEPLPERGDSKGETRKG